MAGICTAYLSIGSNKENKRQNLDQAIQCLNRHEEIQVSAVSKFYRTQPTDFTDQDWFVNAALEIKTGIRDPHDLLTALKQIERDLDPGGKDFRFGPRKIDLDILYFEDRVVKTSSLEIPHPRMHERCFVLRPLCDINPLAVHPLLEKSTADLMKKIENQDGQAVAPLDMEE